MEELQKPKKLKKLPNAQFSIMSAVWASEPPVTANTIIQQYGDKVSLKVQTATSLLLRLVERGFLHIEKDSKEQAYSPIVSREEYLRFETAIFVKRFYNNSFINLSTIMFDGEAFTDEDIEELRGLVNRNYQNQ